MTQTEKPTTIAEKKQQGIVETKKQKIETPKKMTEQQEKVAEKLEGKHEEKKETEKPVKTKPKEKKNEAVVKGTSLHISTKKSMAICKFIKRKKIEQAIEDLEKVVAKKIAVPMKGEIPHQKGVGKFASGSGRYPKKTAEHFIKLLKSLQANASVNELEEPIIAEAVANIAPRPFGKFGRVKRKRTHVKIIARGKKMIKINKQRGGK